MNDTVTGMKQATTKGDIMSLLFKSKNGASLDKDSATGDPISFQSVLQASLKSNKNKEIKTNTRTSLQAIIQKKADNTTAARKPAQAKIAGQTEQAGMVHQGKADDVSMNDAMTEGIFDQGAMQPNDLSVMLQAIETIKNKDTKLVNLKTASGKDLQPETNPVGLKIKDIETGKRIVLQKTVETESAAVSSSNSSEKDKDTVPARERQITAKTAEMALKVTASDGSADAKKSKTGADTEDKIAQLETAVAKMIEKETEGLTEEAATVIAAQVSPVIADFMKSTANRTASQGKETGGTKQIETETLFKAKIADVLTGNGVDQETAERIAGQIRTVTVVNEKSLPDMNGSAKSLFGQMLQKEAENTQTAAQTTSTAGSSPVLDKAASGIQTVENTAGNSVAGIDYRGKDTREAKDIKRDGTSFAVANGNEAIRGREATLAETETSTGFAQEDSQRTSVGQTRTKSDGIERIGNHDAVPNLSVQQQASVGSESTSNAQSVRAQDIINQIADLKSAQTDQSGRVKVVLDPPNLGTVEMDIIVRGDRINAVMTAETKEVRQILQSHADEMKQALSDQGFRIDRIEVKQPEEKGSQQWAGNGREWNQSQQQDGGYRQRREREQQQSKFDMSEYMTQVSVTV